MSRQQARVEILTDNSGNKVGLAKADDIYMPVWSGPFQVYNNFEKVGDLCLGEDDVFIVAYLKSGISAEWRFLQEIPSTFSHNASVIVQDLESIKFETLVTISRCTGISFREGTHWLYEMVGMLLQGKAETLQKTKEVFMLDCCDIDVLNSSQSPRVVNTHYWPKHIPQELLRNTNVIYLLRNPKDVAVSSYFAHLKFKVSPALNIPQYSGTFNDFLEWFLEGNVEYGSWFEHVRAWEEFFKKTRDVNPLIIYYEDIKRDTVGILRRIADHIGISCSEEFLSHVAAECHIDRMRVTNDQRVDHVKSATIDGKSPMYRKGMVGDWKNHFTVASNEKFDILFREKMNGSQLHFGFEI